MAQTAVQDFVSVKFDVGQAVSSALDAFSKERSRLQAQNDTKFYQAVAGGMSFADQLTFRQTQLEEEQGRTVPDQDYIETLKQGVADLTKQAKYEKIRNTYKTALTATVGGLESWQQYYNDIQNLLQSEQDPDMRTELMSQLQTASSNVLQGKLSLINNETTKANTDKSIPELQKALDDASSAKAEALAANDDVRASSMDANIAAIKQSMSNIKIDNENNALTLTRARKASAVGYVQNINDLIGSSDSSTPIVYQGVPYASEAQYWQTNLNKYIDTNFFSQLQTEYDDYLNSAGRVNGIIPDSVLAGVQSDFQQLGNNANIQPFINRLQVVQSATLAKAVDINATAIVDQFGVDDNYNSALQKLSDLKVKYGIDTTSYANKVIQSVAQTKGQQFSAFSDQVNTLVAQGMDYNSAVAQVSGNIKAGKVAAPTESSQELATKTPEQLAKEAPGKTTAQFNEPGAPTIPPAGGQNPAQADNQPVQTPGQAAGLTTTPVGPAAPDGLKVPAEPAKIESLATPGFSTYVVKAGDTLSKLSQQFYGDSTSYQKIFEANKDVLSNPNTIKTGQQLKIPTQEAAAK